MSHDGFIHNALAAHPAHDPFQLQVRRDGIPAANRNLTTAIARAAIAILLPAAMLIPVASLRADGPSESKPAAVDPALVVTNKVAPSASSDPASKPDADETRIEALGSVGLYDRVPAWAAGGHGPQSVPVVFHVPSDDVQAIVKRLDAHETMVVDVYRRDLKTKIAQGSLIGVDSQIDSTTGTLTCKAIVYPLGDVLLYPNQFINVQLHLASMQSATTRPSAADDAHRQVLEVELKRAKAEAAIQEKAFKAGSLSALDFEKGKDAVEILQAELTGDSVKIAKVRLLTAQRQLELCTKLYQTGMLTTLDFEKAKSAVNIAEAQLHEATSMKTPPGAR